MTDLEKSILSTIAYFDVFDYPLTSVELWKWLYIDPGQKNLRTEEQIRIFDIKNILEHSDFLKQKVDSKYGFYFLKGREEIVELRRERYSLAERKFKKVIKIIKILQLVPYIKMIAICNTLSYSNCRDEGDIDLFIVCEKNHLWKTRFLVSGFLQFFHLRPTKSETRDKICASFFLSEENLSIKNLSIGDDIYLKYWITQIFPVYDEGVYYKFLLANTWVKDSLPNYIVIQPSMRRRLKPSYFKLIFKLILSILPENYCKNYQWKILPENLRKIVNKDTRVVMNDQMLKFHDNDKREIFNNKFREGLAKLE